MLVGCSGLQAAKPRGHLWTKARFRIVGARAPLDEGGVGSSERGLESAQRIEWVTQPKAARRAGSRVDGVVGARIGAG